MKNKGISLIVLIITIVVIIILSTAIIVNLLQTNLISKAKKAVFLQDISIMQDELKIYITNKYTETLGKYEVDKLQATEEGIWYGTIQEEGTIRDIIPSMKEEYIKKIFIQDGELVANKLNITVEEEKILKGIGVKIGYQADIGKIDIIPSTVEWTKESVELRISYTKEIPEGYALEYSVNSGEWLEGNSVIIEENNSIVTVRIYNKEKDNEALTSSYEVSNIDKENPSKPTDINIVVGTNSVIATASGSTDKLSGISKYQYSKDNITWQDSGVFNNIKSSTEIIIYARAIDKVGNISEIIQDNVKTNIIAEPEINLSTIEWTNEDVTANITGVTPEGYVLEYKLSGGIVKDWTTYTGNIVIDTNNTTIIARYYNENVEDEIDGIPKTVSNIDKDIPNIINIINSSNNNWLSDDVIISFNSSDDMSGILKVVYSYDRIEEYDNWNNTNYNNMSDTWSDESNVELYLKAYDKAGNESEWISAGYIKIDKTNPIANITTYSIEGYTSESIIIDVDQNDEYSGINIKGCKWVFNNSSSNLGKNSELYTGGTFESTHQPVTLKATSPGNYYLHVLTKDNAGNTIETISDKITIKQYVTGITISGSNSVIIGNTVQLTTNVLPSNATNKEITWESSDESIATISSTGLITSKAAGTTTITVNANDGSNVSSTLKFTVNKDSSVKILIIEDYNYSKQGNNYLYTKLSSYFTNVTYDNNLTQEQLLASNYDVYISSGMFWGAPRAEDINALFAAGKNVFTCGNDTSTTHGFSIIDSSVAISGTYTANKVTSNSISSYMSNSMTESDSGMSILKFVTGTEKWYTTTYNNETYDVVGCLTGNSQNRWVHSQFYHFIYGGICNLQQLMYYIAGKK